MANFECHYKTKGNLTFIRVTIKDKKWTEKGKVLTALKELKEQKIIEIPDPKKTEFDIPFALPCSIEKDLTLHPDNPHWNRDPLALTEAYFAPLIVTFKTIGKKLCKVVDPLNPDALKLAARTAVLGALCHLYPKIDITAYDGIE